MTYHQAQLVVLWCGRGKPVPVIESAQSVESRGHDSHRAREIPDAIWTAANTQEALIDPVTPLTWTFLIPMVERGRRELFQAAGFEEIDADYLRLICGRAYFNPDYFRRFLAQLPGVPVDIFDALIFGEGRPEVRFRLQHFSWRSVQAAVMLAVARLRHGPLMLERAGQRCNESIRALTRTNLGAEDSSDILRRVDAVGRVVERALRLHVVGTAMAGASYLLLDIAVRRLVPGQWAQPVGDGSWQAAGSNLTARLTAGARSSLQSLANAELFEVLSCPPGVRREAGLRRFLARYGHRSVHEAELAAPRWSEDETFVRRLVEEARAARGQEHPVERERRIRRRAQALERRISRSLGQGSGWLERVCGMRRLVTRLLIREARAYAPHREDLKFQALLGLNLVRASFLELGRRLERLGLLARGDDVFFLEARELRDCVSALAQGRMPVAGLRQLARERRERHARWCDSVPPREVAAPGRMADASWAGMGEWDPGPCPPDQPLIGDGVGARLEGVAASAGKVRARARILAAPEESPRLRAGEVLVTRALNAGWTPLFLAAGAAVSDVGGLLSHAAVVAREYGLPLVMGARQATSWIRDGDLVEVDGDSGTVTIIERARAGGCR